MLILAACTGPNNASTPTPPKNEKAFNQKDLPAKGEEIAVISTEFGDMKVRFFPEKAPKTVENFVTHAKNGYYDGIIFHRIIDGFMIQGGDPTGTGAGGESIWGGKFDDELNKDLKNVRGALAMANAGANTNGSQFFINQVENVNLNGYDQSGKLKSCSTQGVSCHSVFGQVFDGLDVIDSIAKVEKGPGDKPAQDIPMTVKIVKYGE